MTVNLSSWDLISYQDELDYTLFTPSIETRWDLISYQDELDLLGSTRHSDMGWDLISYQDELDFSLHFHAQTCVGI